MRMKHTSAQVKTSPANYTPNVIPAKSKAVSSGPKVTVKKKYARKNMPNIKGFEPVFQMSGGPGMNAEAAARKNLRVKQGL